ncbi:hypothetical protein KKH23_10600 [Patescibacteria group bacterium]|nr:hypothetical protein [Patescibacteria group bacterium]
MDDFVIKFLLSGISDKQKPFYREIIRQNDADGVNNYVLLYPEGCKEGWSLIINSQVIAGGSWGSPIPLGYPVFPRAV